jgi:FAD-dependent urate hydroxylase
MALEDAVILAQRLRDISRIPEALATFVQLRRERVERVIQAGASTGNPSPPTPGPRKGGPSTWLYGHHIDWDTTVHTVDDALTAPHAPDQPA